ncbi:flagellar hook-associated protein 3 FlgL [Anaerobacterium chartisolvens]|uniref:Flagellar hook-associated protein 3 FlgL n=1 Tax=Anaerobacterium chartisolvens TaxID=1297424 RepID=A0A369AZS0_9FIRM|nr:flagellar hook-associated protein FlgL [Anaerobacterium chartisolvens]RCX14779.1 flagellar hook-associated protein 3 FlgL [Anaerobacterium chartisolvens]
MRITNTMLINNMMNAMKNNLSRLDKYQMQMATGKKIRIPSDDPVVAARALKLRTDVSELQQYKKNVKDAGSWLDTTESALTNVGDVLHRLNELAVQASTGTVTTEDSQKICEEAKQLKTQLVHIANTTYAGRYIFSGYKTNQAFMNADGTFNIDVDNAEAVKYEIGIGDDININVAGGDLFNSGTNAAAGATGAMMQHVDSFITALETGDKTGISQMIEDANSDMADVLRIRADVGARQNRLELTENRLGDDELNFSERMSDNENADIAETIMNLKNEENVYSASLAGGARIIQPSLVDFLR